jgi:hypothetical protein
MLDDLETDELLSERGDPTDPDAVYWGKNYARMRGYLASFRDLTLKDSISLYQVQQFQSDLDTAVDYVNEREKQARKRLRDAKLRNVTGREPEEAAAYLAKADALEEAS